MAAAQQVQMQMKYGLAGASTVVEDGTVACQQIPLSRQLRRHQVQFADHRLIFCGGLVQRFKVFSWAEQDVRGRLRADILEGEDFWIFVNDF